MSAEKKSDPKQKKGSVTYKLKYPIEWGSETISELVFTRPKGKHLKKMHEKMNLGELMDIAQSCSGQPTPVFDALDGEDYCAIGEIVGNFLDSGRKTGTKT